MCHIYVLQTEQRVFNKRKDYCICEQSLIKKKLNKTNMRSAKQRIKIKLTDKHLVPSKKELIKTTNL